MVYGTSMGLRSVVYVHYLAVFACVSKHLKDEPL